MHTICLTGPMSDLLLFFLNGLNASHVHNAYPDGNLILNTYEIN